MPTNYQRIGSGIEDMKTSLNYEIETKKDILGQSSTKATKGNNTITIEPLTINPNSEFAKFVDTAIERQYELSDLEKWFVFVKKYKTVGGKMAAFRQKAVVVPQDWAMGNAELAGSVELNLIGEREFGTFNVVEGSGTFTVEVAPPADGSITYTTGDAKREDFGMYYEYVGA